MDKKQQIIDEWIKKAEQDLGMAKLAIEYQPDFRYSICFHCQQAAEKYLRVDDIYSTAEILEGYGVEIRYPGYAEPTEKDVEEAYQAAMDIKKVIIEKMNRK